jgi:PAS domain S-box-containing protein
VTAERDRGQRDADRRLRDVETRMGLMLDGVTDHAVVVLDARGSVVTWHIGQAHVFGYAAEAMADVPAAPLFDLTTEELAARLQEAGRSGVAAWEGNCRRADGTTFVGTTTIRPLEPDGDDGAEFVAVIRDVTEQRDLQGRLRQSQKMEAIGQLAGGVAHDFNNLLTAILGYAEWLEQDRSISEGSRRHIAEITRAAERAADLTRQLLTLGRRQISQPTVVDLSTLVGGMLPMLRRIIGEHIAIVSETHAESLPVLSDHGQLEQIMLNLAVNARDAMPDGGRLTIRTDREDLDASEAGGDVEPGAYAVLDVADTGKGMDDTTRARAFEPFFTTKEAGQGTGLGLATVYGIVKQMGGSVRIVSASGRGTTFRLYFPQAEAGVAVGSEDLSDDVPGGDETVLLVEDDLSVRTFLDKVLVRNGYRVLAAEHPPAALELVKAHSGPIDLVITDIVMPFGNGIELVGMLDEIRPGLPVLYISGYADPALVERGALPQADHFLQKPFSAATLLLRIRQVLSSSA